MLPSDRMRTSEVRKGIIPAKSTVLMNGVVLTSDSSNPVDLDGLSVWDASGWSSSGMLEDWTVAMSYVRGSMFGPLPVDITSLP